MSAEMEAVAREAVDLYHRRLGPVTDRLQTVAAFEDGLKTGWRAANATIAAQAKALGAVRAAFRANLSGDGEASEWSRGYVDAFRFMAAAMCGDYTTAATSYRDGDAIGSVERLLERAALETADRLLGERDDALASAKAEIERLRAVAQRVGELSGRWQRRSAKLGGPKSPVAICAEELKDALR